MSLVFQIRDREGGGFFCSLWKLTSNMLYAKKNNLKFFIDDKSWMFAHTLGWRDYFTSLQLVSEHETIPQPIHDECRVNDSRLYQFVLDEYLTTCKEIYKLNNNMELLYKKQRDMLPAIYHAIMIRRGDKMVEESMYIETHKYIETLLDKGHYDIFVQTDDYTAFEEVYDYCKIHYPHINVKTTCPSTKRGAFMFTYRPSAGSHVSERNNSYLLQLSNISQKSVDSYSPDEMREHVEEMLVGLQICMNSEYLCTDFQSNVTRYLFCCHKYPDHVLLIDSSLPPSDSVLLCPAIGFIKI
jgi:hypothetical protein